MTAASLEQVALAKAHSPRPTNATGTGFVEANDNTLPLRGLIRSTLRLAGRLALTRLRSIVHPGRAVHSAFGSDSFLVTKRIPRALTKVSYSRPFMSCAPINFGAVRPALITTGR